MTEMAILFDSSRCTGCRGCQVACKCWNDLPSEPTAENPYDSVNWDGKFTHPADLNSCTRLIMTFEDFEDEKSQKRVGWAFGRRACQHCTNAGCVNMCPAGALYKDEETGMVTYDQDKCIGCQNCSAACPYDVPRYEDRGGKTVINKCSGCVDRIAQGMMPACVTTCQPGALQFGTREEMIALANERLQLLRDRGYENACIYGENEMEGLHVIQVLKHGTKPHGAVENPQIPPAAFLSGIMKPVTAVGADDGNQHEHDAEDAMAHTECEDHIRTHHGCQRRHEHESAREHQPHAAANGDAMRPASLPGVTLDIAFASNFASAQERFIFSLFFRRDVELSVLTHGHRPLSCQWEGSR